MDKKTLQEIYQLLDTLVGDTNPDNIKEYAEMQAYRVLVEAKYHLAELGFENESSDNEDSNEMTRERAMDIAHDYIAHDLEGADLGYVQDVVDELGITNDELYELGLECLMNVMA